MILGGYLDNSMRTLLQARMRYLKPTEDKKLFQDRGPLSDFAARIDVAYALDLITADERDDLHHIREIRNTFAHAPRSIDFDYPSIAQKCSQMNDGSILRLPLATVRQAFTDRALDLILSVGNKAIELLDEKLPKVPPPLRHLGSFDATAFTSVPQKPSPEKSSATAIPKSRSPRKTTPKPPSLPRPSPESPPKRKRPGVRERRAKKAEKK